MLYELPMVFAIDGAPLATQPEKSYVKVVNTTADCAAAWFEEML